jgi:Ca-activated chloride channel family protein
MTLSRRGVRIVAGACCRPRAHETIGSLQSSRMESVQSSPPVISVTQLNAAVRGLIEGETSPQPASGTPLGAAASAPAETAGTSGTAPRKPVSLPKVPPGSNTAAAIVLLSDGQSNVGPDAVKMAQVAADLGVRVYTVGVGTAQGTVLKAQGMQMRVKLDEASLKKIAEITKAEYFSADNRQELLQIYQSLSSKIVLKKHRRTEVSALCALLGMLLLTWGSAWAWWRHGRII